MTHLYFIRHGQSAMNAVGLFAGSLDSPLTDTGREQAKAAGKAAKSLGIDIIISSPMSRAYETAQIIARELGIDESHIVLDEDLVERHFGEREGQPWQPGIDLSGTPGLEPIEQFRARVNAGLQRAQNRPEGVVLIVAHGAVYRMLRELTEADYTFLNTTAYSENAQVIQLA